MRIPTFVVFDSDSNEQDPQNRSKHKKDNKALLAILGCAGQNPLPTGNVWGTGFVMWHSNIGIMVREEIGQTEWQTYQAAADKQYSYAGNLRKNTLHIGASLALAWEAGKKSPNLERLCMKILNLDNSA